ncbi:hypothetical protein [Rhodococcus sp. 4CII]|uniref:hypothetical protein n=1 Tax=Rhodococcus sp. 4CII TaxID=2834580 RepID=UPI00163A3B73|nr:hypothetical protein [Rhodococcus sp. 4CII]MBC2638244.1 hypothetical protein [Rhodococcus sp. 3A]
MSQQIALTVQPLEYGAAFLGLYAGAHVAMRFLAPCADPHPVLWGLRPGVCRSLRDHRDGARISVQ